jgi:hypothetical protein
LNPSENFPFQHGDEREEGKKDRQQGNNVDQTRNKLPKPNRRCGERRKDVFLRLNKNLVEKTAHVGWKESGVLFLSQDRNGVRANEFCFVSEGVALLLLP